MHYPEASDAIMARMAADIAEEREADLLDAPLQDAAPPADDQGLTRLAVLFGSLELAQPAPQFTQRVLGRVRRRRRVLTALRWGLVGLLGLTVGLALCLAPLASPTSPLAEVMAHPSLLSSVVGVLVRGLDLLGTLLGAARLVAQAVLASPGFVGLIGLVGAAGLVSLLWVRVVLRASRLVRRV